MTTQTQPHPNSPSDSQVEAFEILTGDIITGLLEDVRTLASLTGATPEDTLDHLAHYRSGTGSDLIAVQFMRRLRSQCQVPATLGGASLEDTVEAVIMEADVELRDLREIVTVFQSPRFLPPCEICGEGVDIDSGTGAEMFHPDDPGEFGGLVHAECGIARGWEIA